MKNFLSTNICFDFSSYPEDSKFFDPANKKVIGKMKDESEGKIIDEFIGLKSEMYFMKNIDGKESNMAKVLVNIATEFTEVKKTLCSTRKWSDIKWEEFKAKTKNGIIQNQQNIILYFWWKKIFKWW